MSPNNSAFEVHTEQNTEISQYPWHYVHKPHNDDTNTLDPFPSPRVNSLKPQPFKCTDVLTKLHTPVWLINFYPCTTCSNHSGHAWSALQPTVRTFIKGHAWVGGEMHHCNCYMPNLVEHCISFRLLSAIDLCYCNPIDFHNCTQWAISH